MKSLAIVGSVWLATLLQAAVPAQPLSFEVATIKPHVDKERPVEMTIGGRCRGSDDKAQNGPLAETPLGRCSFLRMGLRGLLYLAYSDRNPGVPMAQMVSGGPSWLDNDIFDIEAKAEDPATATHAQLLEMLRNLLIERFKIHYHQEAREVSGLALTVSKGGPRMDESSSGTFDGLRFGGGKVVAEHITMGTLAGALRGQLQVGLVDKTGLNGTYAFTLLQPEGAGGDSSWLRSAIQDLGLRLESNKFEVDVFVVDSAERPAP